MLQLFAKGSCSTRARAAASSPRPRPARSALGEGAADACLGDFDGDGLLDIFTVAEDSPRLWQNLGGGKFVDDFAHLRRDRPTSPSPAASAATPATSTTTAGRTSSSSTRTMAPAGLLQPRLPQLRPRPQALDLDEPAACRRPRRASRPACVADFNGDGAQDMALVLTNGTVCFLPQAPFGEPCCRARGPGAGRRLRRAGDGRRPRTGGAAGRPGGAPGQARPSSAGLTRRDHRDLAAPGENRPQSRTVRDRGPVRAPPDRRRAMTAARRGVDPRRRRPGGGPGCGRPRPSSGCSSWPGPGLP